MTKQERSAYWPGRHKTVLALTAATRIYLYRPSCDMRKSVDGLCGLIRSELDADPLSGSLLVFRWLTRQLTSAHARN